MKQVLQYINTGETKVVDVPIPQVQKKTALVRTAASLVSAGTERSLVEFAEKNLMQKAKSRPDLVKQVLDKAKREGILTTLDSTFNRLDQPLVLGYSSAGTITEVGEGLEGFQVGDRVVCAGGNHAVHAEYAVIPQNLLALYTEKVEVSRGADILLVKRKAKKSDDLAHACGFAAAALWQISGEWPQFDQLVESQITRMDEDSDSPAQWDAVDVTTERASISQEAEAGQTQWWKLKSVK